MIRDPRLIFEKHRPGRRAVRFPGEDSVPPPSAFLPEEAVRKAPPPLPETGELDLVRHYTGLSRRNVGVDNLFYPLGSCTMKYNPAVNEALSAAPGFCHLHPYQPEETVQGILEVLHLTERWLAEIAGLAAVSLHPAAGAHGELTALLVIRKHLEARNEKGRTTVLIPDSAHGTNPASCTLAGFKTRQVRSSKKTGLVDLADLEKKLGPDTAAVMITNPNTLGLFERDIQTIAAMVHEAGGQVYMDGANLNALLGIARPGDFGVDIMHFNLHKTFSTPHGGGGPGAGPIGVQAHLEPHLPVPRVVRDGDRFRLSSDFPHSIGRTRSFAGNALVVLRAFAYLLSLGRNGLKRVAEGAVLNANYLRVRIREHYRIPFDGLCMHEFVAAPRKTGKVRTLDMAKRLIDLGFHPPTVYFPLIVPEAIMIEPTETESRETLDAFAEAMERIAREAAEDPEALRSAPHTTPVSRLDEVRAVRDPVLRWEPAEE